MNGTHATATFRSFLTRGLLASLALLPLGANAQVQHYTLTDLTSNQASLAPSQDANLVNAWGLSRSSKSPWWVSDNGSGLSTLYDGTGKTIPLVVTVPSGSGKGAGSPTGTVYNGDSNAFMLAPGKPAVFMFVTEDGTISAWNPGVNLGAAMIMVNNPNAVYKGATVLTLDSATGPQSFLFVANFRSGKVEVFDATFKRANIPEEAYNSVHPRGFGAFNVQNIGGNLYVAYARQDGAKQNEVEGTALGFVEVYSPLGYRLMGLQRGEWFNTPWGMALASGDFGEYSHDVLVGNFGSGEIAAFDPLTGVYKGTLQDANNMPLKIDGLWAIAFGNDAGAGPATTLYFAGGPSHETNGIFGSITAVENIKGNDQ